MAAGRFLDGLNGVQCNSKMREKRKTMSAPGRTQVLILGGGFGGLYAALECIDLSAKKVTVVHGLERHSHKLRYDYLILALGSMTNFFGLPELQRRATTMKSLSDPIHLRNRLIYLLEEADFECAAGSRPNLLTIVVAGGGFAGTETVAAVTISSVSRFNSIHT